MRMEKRKQLDLSWWKYIRGAVVSLVIIINQGNPTESQLMRMKEWNNLLQLIKMNDREQFDQSLWEWRCWPAGLELMTMSEKRVCHSWWEWMSGNIWSHLRKMNESKADENEWERRTVCYSWWEWMREKNSLLQLMRKNEREEQFVTADEKEWERRTVCYSWWERMREKNSLLQLMRMNEWEHGS